MAELSTALFDIGAIRFGSFTLKSGIVSPIYIDLRLSVSYPALMRRLAAQMAEITRECHYDVLCGVPYTALPLATAWSLAENRPMVMRRKEVKDYGTKRAIEGAFEPQQRCLIVEDLVTSGGSVLETVEALQAVELQVSDAVVLIDREQGARQILADKGIKLHAVITLSTLLEELYDAEKIDSKTRDATVAFIKANQLEASHA